MSEHRCVDEVAEPSDDSPVGRRRPTRARASGLPEIGTAERVALPRWVGPLFLLLAAGLVPWVVFLAATLPRRAEAEHYRLAWVGFDLGMLAMLAALGWLAVQRSRWTESLASSAATLLVVDAWFDVVTANSRQDLIVAAASAAIFELPLAVVCVWLARNAERVRRRGVRKLGQRVVELELRLHRTLRPARTDD